MVSLWHAFDLAASLDSRRTGVEAQPRSAAGRARPLPSWLRSELLTPDAARAHEPAWRGLAARAVIPNVFGEPEIALPAATHLMQGQEPRFLFVWDERTDPGARLILSAPLVLPALGVGEAALWSHELLASTLPLIDRDASEAAFDALLEAIRVGPARATGLKLPGLDERSVFAEKMRRAAARAGRTILRLERSRPAEIVALPEAAAALPTPRGSVSRSPRRVREAVEHFLAIEAVGPAGESGEALLLSPQSSAFLRVVTRSLARQRRCHVELRLAQGRPVGADILLRFGEADMLWRSAGVAGTAERSRLGALPGRRDRAHEVDWLITARSGPSPAVLALAARDALSRRIREVVKRMRRHR